MRRSWRIGEIGRLAAGAVLCLLLYIEGAGPAFGGSVVPADGPASDAPLPDAKPPDDRPLFIPMPVEPVANRKVAELLAQAWTKAEAMRFPDAEKDFRTALAQAGRLKDPLLKTKARVYADYGLAQVLGITHRQAEAKAAYLEAATIAQTLGEDCVERGYSLLGLALMDIMLHENYPTAREHAQKAFNILTALLSESHVDTLESEWVLILTLVLTKDSQQAPQMLHLLEYSKETSTPRAQERAAYMYHRLAVWSLQQPIGSAEEARPIYIESESRALHALELWKTLEKPSQDSIERALSLLGLLHARLGQYAQAEVELKQLLESTRATDPASADTIGTTLAVAEVLMLQKKAAEACSLLQSVRKPALAAPNRSLGLGFKVVLMLARCWVDQQRWIAAEAEIREAQKFKGEDLPRRYYQALLHAENAVVSLRLGRTDEGMRALDEMTQVIIDENIQLRPDHAVRSYLLIGETLLAAEDFKQALMYFRRAVTATRFGGIPDIDIAHCLLGLGLALDAMGPSYESDALEQMTEGMAKYREAKLPHDEQWKAAQHVLIGRATSRVSTSSE